MTATNDTPLSELLSLMRRALGMAQIALDAMEFSDTGGEDGPGNCPVCHRRSEHRADCKYKATQDAIWDALNYDLRIDVEAAEAARTLRSIPSEKRSAASRENGRKGGRPRKQPKE